MEIIDASTFRAASPWAARDVTAIDDATVRLHWTDQPYHWHINDGPEVFVVLDGAVDMHVRRDGLEEVHRLEPGKVCFADVGDEHVAYPIGEARVLVVERRGSE